MRVVEYPGPIITNSLVLYKPTNDTHCLPYDDHGIPPICSGAYNLDKNRGVSFRSDIATGIHDVAEASGNDEITINFLLLGF